MVGFAGLNGETSGSGRVYVFLIQIFEIYKKFITVYCLI